MLFRRVGIGKLDDVQSLFQGTLGYLVVGQEVEEEKKAC